MPKLNRLLVLDNLRGIAFIFMIIHHIFYFYDASNGYKTNLSDNIFVDTSGFIARNLFILLTGYSLITAYNNKKEHFYNKRLQKSLLILLHGMLITLVTYYFYPTYFIKFGVLHFIAVATFILSFIVPYPKLYIIILLISLFYKPPILNNFIDIISGSSPGYMMMDWFSLSKWMPLMIAGMIVGNKINLEDIPVLQFLKINNILTYLGENSLNLYTIHVIGLILFYEYIKYLKHKI